MFGFFTKDAFFACYFFLSVVVIVFLAFQVSTNFNTELEGYSFGQRDIKLSANSVIASATQMHPLFSYDEVLRAQFLFDRVVTHYGGVIKAETILGTPKGELSQLQTKIELQKKAVQDYLMDHFIAVNPELDTELNRTAGLDVRKRTKSRKPK